MDNYQGDLTDIIRASGASYGSCSTGTSSFETVPFSMDHWQFSSAPINFSSVLEDPFGGNFGDPFSNMKDPFLHELVMPGSANTGRLEEAACFGGGSSDPCVLAQKIILEDDMRRPCKLSNMIQISPNSKLPISSQGDSTVMNALSRVDNKSSAVVSVSDKMINAKTSKDHSLVGNTGVQISSPRYPGLKGRKSQAKKSICIPAPAAAPNSRQSGEVVPSDMWTWRKYGQKPIKGSPYPRAYYRCSSSKGCPARKQVERSRTDPSMLVITYSSEHNHPWPTHRNALAGSTRSQPSKNNATPKNSEPKNGTTKSEEEHQESNSDSNVSPVVGGNSTNSASVKEEIEMDVGELNNGPQYKPSKMKCNQLEDLFAELGEIEADSMNLLSAQGFDAVDDQQRESKSLDPFNLFEWSGYNSTKYHLI